LEKYYCFQQNHSAQGSTDTKPVMTDDCLKFIFVSCSLWNSPLMSDFFCSCYSTMF